MFLLIDIAGPFFILLLVAIALVRMRESTPIESLMLLGAFASAFLARILFMALYLDYQYDLGLVQPWKKPIIFYINIVLGMVSSMFILCAVCVSCLSSNYNISDGFRWWKKLCSSFIVKS